MCNSINVHNIQFNLMKCINYMLRIMFVNIDLEVHVDSAVKAIMGGSSIVGEELSERDEFRRREVCIRGYLREVLVDEFRYFPYTPGPGILVILLHLRENSTTTLQSDVSAHFVSLA